MPYNDRVDGYDNSVATYWAAKDRRREAELG